MKNLFLLFLLSLVTLSLYSQETKIIKYYDSIWRPTSKAEAYFYSEFTKHDSLYNCISYWTQSGKLNFTGVYKDTLFIKLAGPLLRYYEDGRLEDSTYTFENGRIKNSYHYYPSGHLWAHFYYDAVKEKETTECFDEQGHSIEHVVYLKEATFPGGINNWGLYLVKLLNKKVPARNGAPKGIYKVIIGFVVETNGQVSNVEAETNLGYGMEKEAIRVIKKSPNWDPLVILGIPKRVYLRQPITFLVND